MISKMFWPHENLIHWENVHIKYAVKMELQFQKFIFWSVVRIITHFSASSRK